MKLPEIKGFIDLSLVDWDGRVSSVIFLPKCNFRCPFCYNVHLVLNPDKMPTILYQEIESYLKRYKLQLDGVAITGGEPTICDELAALCRRIKEIGLGIKLDTNGSNPEMVEELMEEKLVDYVALDVKAPLTTEKYSSVIGVEAKELLPRVEKTMEILFEGSIDYEFRTTVVPKFHGKRDIREICSRLRHCKKYVIQNFKGDVETLDKRLRDVKPFSPDKMEDFLTLARKAVPNSFLR